MNTSEKIELQNYYERDEWNKAAMRHLTTKLCEWHAKAAMIQRLTLELAQEISNEALDYTAITKD